MKFITWIILALTKKFETKLTRSNTDKLSLFETTTSINDSPLVPAFKSVLFLYNYNMYSFDDHKG